MHTRNFSFFTLDGEIDIKDGPVSIITDHRALMSVVYFNHWDTLGFYEKEFAIWYQEETLIKGQLPPLSFIVDPSVLEPYNQENLCKYILDFVRIETVEDYYGD